MRHTAMCQHNEQEDTGLGEYKSTTKTDRNAVEVSVGGGRLTTPAVVRDPHRVVHVLDDYSRYSWCGSSLQLAKRACCDIPRESLARVLVVSVRGLELHPLVASPERDVPDPNLKLGIPRELLREGAQPVLTCLDR